MTREKRERAPCIDSSYRAYRAGMRVAQLELLCLRLPVGPWGLSLRVLNAACAGLMCTSHAGGV